MAPIAFLSLTAQFTQPVGVAPAAQSAAAKALLIPGLDPQRPLRNHILGKSDFAAVGGPVFAGNNRFQCTAASKYIQSGFPDAAATTLIVVARSSEAFSTDPTSKPVFAGNQTTGTGAIGGVNIYVDGTPSTPPAALVRGLTSFVGNATVNLNVTDMSAWKWFALVVTPGVGQTLYNRTDNTQATFNVTTARSVGTAQIRFGSSVNTFSGDCEIGLGMIIHAACSADDITALYNQHKALLAAMASPIAI